VVVVVVVVPAPSASCRAQPPPPPPPPPPTAIGTTSGNAPRRASWLCWGRLFLSCTCCGDWCALITHVASIHREDTDPPALLLPWRRLFVGSFDCAWTISVYKVLAHAALIKQEGAPSCGTSPRCHCRVRWSPSQLTERQLCSSSQSAC